MLDIGFDIGGTKIAAVAADEDSGIAGKISSPFPKGRDGRFVAKMLYDMAAELMRGCGESTNGVRSAGIAVPGSISRTSTPPSPAMHRARIMLASGIK